MTRLRIRVAPIIEGDGEEEAVRILLERTWRELLGGEYIDVLTPIRHPRSRLVIRKHLERAVRLASMKLSDAAQRLDLPELIFILIDADDDLPCKLGPRLLQDALSFGIQKPISCIIANLEYETWFVAAAESLRQHLHIGAYEIIPEDPEASRSKKKWIIDRFRGSKYSETIDQPRLTAAMDLSVCRSRSASFDKFCRELERQRDNHD